MPSIRKQSRERYYDEHGVQCQRAQARTKKTEKSQIYYAFGAIPGSRKPIPLAKTRSESVAMLARILAGVEILKTKTLAGHLTNWAAALKLAGITQARQNEVVAKVRRILEAAGTLQSRTISAEQARAVFTRWDTEKKRWSAQTKAHYLKALNQFLRHAGLPAIRITLPVIRANKTYQRGALTPEQAAALIHAAAAGTAYRGLPGQRRALLYRLILTTGLRRKEAMGLTHEHLTQSRISLLAHETKNRRPAEIDLGPELSTALATVGQGRIFPGTWGDRSAVMVRRDAAAAGIIVPFRLDLHTLRHTFISWCAAKFRVEITQKLARHSTSVLTLDYYTHAKNDDVNAAAATIEDELNRCAFRCANIFENGGGAGNQKNQNSKNPRKKLYLIMRPIGVEPITYGSEDRCSIQFLPQII